MPHDVQVHRLKLRELRILLVVRQAGSMAKAAKALAISQPAVSRAIADMEDTLGVPLFDRSSRGIEPTQYGHALLKRGVVVFDELKQGVRDIAYLSNPETGELRIGSSSSLSERIVLAVVNRLSRNILVLSFMSCRAARLRFMIICARGALSLDLHGYAGLSPRTMWTRKSCLKSRLSWWRARRAHGLGDAESSLPSW
jgi:molybdenum-dependent DNA-binding transcriptional regulator ModE